MSILFFLLAYPLAHADSHYPPGFIWGAAYSAHQTEGVQGGGELSDWWDFEHPQTGTSPIRNADTADLAVNQWELYEIDDNQAVQLGLNSVRTSLAWEKIEPIYGVFSTKVIEHYRRRFQAMRAKGIKPMIALHHFVHPKWFHPKGGWLSEESPKWFLEYAHFVVTQLGDLCDLWIPFNEPMVLVLMGYLKAEIPPQLQSLDSAYEAAFQMARAYRMVSAMIHEVQGPSPNGRGPDGKLRGVGLANSLHLYDPLDPQNQKDIEAADWVTQVNNWDFLRGIISDRLEFKLHPEIIFGKNFNREFPKEDLQPWQMGDGLMDWIGVNYYSRYYIKYNPKSLLKVEWVMPTGPSGDNGWSIYPEGLERILRQTAAQFPQTPLVVTENGLADGADSRRGKFIEAHLHSLDGAVFGSSLGNPLDLRGYYHWSLMDNFEWLYGYAYRFGLVEIQYNQNLKRVPRASAEIYKSEILKRNEYPFQ